MSKQSPNHPASPLIGVCPRFDLPAAATVDAAGSFNDRLGSHGLLVALLFPPTQSGSAAGTPEA